MPASKDYQRYAARCREEARIITDSRLRLFLVEMAQAWERLAEQAKTIKGGKVDSAAEPDRGD